MSIWQTPEWTHLLEKSGQVEKVIEIDGIFIEKRKVSFGEFGLFALGVTPPLSLGIMRKLEVICKKENCLFIQVETLEYEGKKYNIDEWKHGYYKKFIPPFTALIDLTKSLDEIKAAMKPKGRYNIGLAQKKGVTCKKVEKDKKNISLFYDIFQETLSRDNFTGNTLAYYTHFLSVVPQSELILAYYQDKVIAGGIFVFREAAIYYYGASSSVDRNVMAPYLVQWTAIEEAKKRGCLLYDFLGVAGPGEKNSPLEGVTDFKLKFTNDVRHVSQSLIYVYKKKKYFFIKLLKKLSDFRKK